MALYEKYVWNSSTNEWDLVVNPDSLFYVAGTGTTAGIWLGSHSRISEYYDGLTIAYKIPIAGASTTTLNINGLGARTVRRNASNLTTHLPVNTVVVLTYTTIGSTGYWVWADYSQSYSLITQSAINTGTETTSRTINASLLRTNFYLKSETDALLDEKTTQAWVTANTRSNTWVPTWAQVTGKPTFATVATSGNYNDLTNKPTIPSIPSVMSTAEGNAGTATTQRTINAANLKSIILNHSPAGSRPASDVYSWAKAENKPSYNLDEISDGSTYKRVTQSEKDGWNSKQNPLGFTPENVANKRNNIRTSGADNASYVSELGVKSYVDTVAATKQDALGFTAVPDTRTIAGLNLTANRTRDQIIGVSANGYLRRTGTNTYDVRSVANLKSDLSLNNVPNVDATNPANISQNANYRFVTDSEKNAWNNKWKQIYAGTSTALTETGFTSISVPSDTYAGKTIAVEIRYGSNSDTTYTNKIVFVTLGTNGTSTASKVYPRYITLSDFDGQFLKNISTKCYVTTGTASSISFGRIRTLIGSFSGTTIEWTTQDTDDINVYIGKIWVLE